MSKKFIILVIAVTGLLLLGGGYIAMSMSSGAKVKEMAGAKLKLAEAKQDFGEVGLDSGEVVKVYEIENVGEGELTLANFVTSCMCTTVKVNIGEGESPEFGMHTKSAWKGVVPPGERAEVVVRFDPAYHGPSGRGAVTRIIKFETNDPENREVELMLTGRVI